MSVRYAPGEFRSPQGLSVDRAGNIIVVDSGNKRVQVFDPAGEFRFEFVTPPESEGSFSFPVDSAVDGRGRIVILDGYQVYVFDAEGAFQRAFGSQGEGEGEFSSPTALTVDSRNNILVADAGTNQIKVFDPDGRFTSQFGAAGAGAGALN
jgi:tripartite motif-containing protein 71